MAFIFTMKSAPVGSGNNSTHRRDPASLSSLPAISEDGNSFISPRDPPPVPPRAWNRPSGRNFALGFPPNFGFEGSPPAYGNNLEEGPLDGESGEKLAELRKGIKNNKHIAKRGGWKRLAIVGAIIVLCLLGLIAGLVVGLRNKNKSSNKDTPNSSAGGASGSIEGSPTNPATNTTFPAGSYSITTYLSTVATNCTSNPSTWLCYPYSTYAQNPSASAATFDWIINPVKDTSNYTISSTDNIFSIMFANLSLSLMSQGQDDEHYFFQTMTQKSTKPTTQLGSQNVAATCYFNQTTLQGYLYTKMPKSYPNNGTNSTSTSKAFIPWPYAVKVEQVAPSGSGAPTCVDASGNSLGDFSTTTAGELCDCLYLNTGT